MSDTLATELFFLPLVHPFNIIYFLKLLDKHKSLLNFNMKLMKLQFLYMMILNELFFLKIAF